MADKKGLNEKQKLFCEYHVLQGLTLKEAYAKAYNRDINSKTVEANASRLASSAKCASYMTHLRSHRLNASGMDKAGVLEAVAEIANSNVLDYVSVRPPDKVELKKDINWKNARAVSEVSVDKDGRVKVKMHPKMDALNLLAKVGGLTLDLNQALQALSNYGYEVIEMPGGYLLQDSYESARSAKDTMMELKQQGYEIVPNGDGTYHVSPANEEAVETEVDSDDELDQKLFDRVEQQEYLS